MSPARISSARKAAFWLAKRLELDPITTDDMVMVITEVLANAIGHGKDSLILVRIQILENVLRIHIRASSHARYVDQIQTALQNNEPMTSHQERGRGLKMAQLFAKISLQKDCLTAVIPKSERQQVAVT